MIHNEILPFIWLIIPCITIAVLFKIRTTYKIAQLKAIGIEKKKESSIEGSLTKLIDDAPNQIKQIDAEMVNIRMNAQKTGMTAEQLKGSLEKLQREKDMLMIPAKYGEVAKPFLKTIDKVASNFLKGFGNG